MSLAVPIGFARLFVVLLTDTFTDSTTCFNISICLIFFTMFPTAFTLLWMAILLRSRRILNIEYSVKLAEFPLAHIQTVVEKSTHSIPRKYQIKNQKTVTNFELPCCMTLFWWCDLQTKCVQHHDFHVINRLPITCVVFFVLFQWLSITLKCTCIQLWSHFYEFFLEFLRFYDYFHEFLRVYVFYYDACRAHRMQFSDHICDLCNY